MPATRPDTRPPPEIVALAGTLLLHVPAGDASLNSVVAPTHTVAVPVMPDGGAMTETVAVTLQLPPSEYVMDAVPGVTPVISPVNRPTLTVVAVLVHEPPMIASLNVVVAPTHTVSLPPIGPGAGLTSTLVVI